MACEPAGTFRNHCVLRVKLDDGTIELFFLLDLEIKEDP